MKMARHPQKNMIHNIFMKDAHMKNNSVCKSKKHSFTLIEVLVAMGIFMIGIAPIMGVLTATTRNFQSETAKSKIGALAEQKFSDVRAGGEPTSEAETTSTSFPGLKYYKGVNTILNNGYDKMYLVTLAVAPTEETKTLNATSIYSANINCQVFTYLHVVE
jgi:type II secretory pathway pseudopilin PulG